MEKILIRNINKKIGPGDIVGALINEADIEPNQIGNINIRTNFAIVEIDENIKEKVIKVMKNNTIAGFEITAEEFSKKKEKQEQKVTTYISNYKSLVQLEREEEMRMHEAEIRNLSGHQREKKGRAILHLRGRDQGTGLKNKFLIKFMRQRRGEKLPENEISIGDLVMLSKRNPLLDDNPTGTVIEKTNYSITVVFDNKPPEFLYKKRLRMDLYVNDITFQRMLDSLSRFSKLKGKFEKIRNSLLGLREPNFGKKRNIDFFNNKLNNSQKEAVKSALAAKDFFLIHGPPGTGKTMTCIEILKQAADGKTEILATADSNTAVDNIVQRLVEKDVKTIRLGHPARVTPILRGHTLDYMLEDHPKYKKARSLREKAMKLKKQQDNYTHPSGRWRRGMSDKRIMKLAKKGKGSRGVPYVKIKEMADWLRIQEKVNNHFDKIDELENEAINDLLDKADVICTTNSTAGSELLEDKKFDLLVHDEATQSSEPSSLIPIIKSKKFILAGDHKQLPPTILNQKAKIEGLSKSIFERLLDIFGDKIKSMLKIQYRMNKTIMNFSAENFYNGQLKAGKEVKNWTLENLNIKNPAFEAEYEKHVFAPNKPFIYLDTADKKSREYSKKDSKSYYNKYEAEIAINLLNKFKQSGINLEDIAVISPYKDQTDFINQQIKNDKIEIDTVDGFQGREKEVIILTLVRSNNNNNIGFLKDLRRLNVSITRAKKKCIVIGDGNTVSSNNTYKKLIKHAKQEEGYYKL
ncbi:MAG: IGHMBP2 family helicase [Candidatus Mcinerneyibacterium aminivorans]|uniref:DNA helicase n=1 Tax=Candidatus Mcinerneyibacterium aminivorans TaxID=2703815 RepID=A0A5D0MB96_9BACT|nr:MAG: IGHMBP2 family helicase [Candidatus Mcinerneyibacterium aminivorans]